MIANNNDHPLKNSKQLHEGQEVKLKAISLADFLPADEPPTLLEIIQRGNLRKDINWDIDLPRRWIDSVVEGFPTAVDDISKDFGIHKNEVYVWATEHGELQITELPEWPPLEGAFSRLRKQAKGQDRAAIRLLEEEHRFRFPRRLNRKTSINLFPWTVTRLTKEATAAGLPKYVLFVAAIILSLDTVPTWSGFFQEDIAEFRKQLQRRRQNLELEL